MQKLTCTADKALRQKSVLPFSIYSSVKEQTLLNVPVVKPLLIVILDGQKILGKQNNTTCSEGEFIFLSDDPNVDMRNIPSNHEYRSLLIEFDEQDFPIKRIDHHHHETFIKGQVNQQLAYCLEQFLDWSVAAPEELWSLRRTEIIQLLSFQGYQQVLSMAANASLSQKVHSILQQHIQEDISVTLLCDQLAMSESTLRRKLMTEGTSLQTIKDLSKLGNGLHLIQTTHLPINIIANQCGYQSQSRFTERFKQRFGLTPSELRKTRLTD